MIVGAAVSGRELFCSNQQEGTIALSGWLPTLGARRARIHGTNCNIEPVALSHMKQDGKTVKGNLKIHLKPKERIYINGAFLRVDRRVTLELLNDMDFLLESHVLARSEATTPLRQLYFVIQSLIIEPHARDIALQVYHAQHRELLATNKDYDLLEALVEVKEMVEQSRTFEALKRIRGLFSLEQGAMPEKKDEALTLSETA